MWPSAEQWGTTQAERRATYPCERYATKPYGRYLRAVDVDADPAVTFRWVCQVKVAPTATTGSTTGAIRARGNSPPAQRSSPSGSYS